MAARSVAEGARTDAEVLKALGGFPAGARPGDLLAATGMNERRLRRSLSRLAERGLVTRDGRALVSLSPAGRGETLGPAPFAPALAESIGCFPAEAQRAFVRLLLSGVVARWHLGNVLPRGWGGFIALGPTKTGKTSAALLACRLLGIPAEQALRLAPDETPGSLFGRRVQTGPADWRFLPAPSLDLPLLCLDEWDKAPEEVRRTAGKLLLGQAEVVLEGQRVGVRPAICLCLNTGPAGLGVLHEAYRRRSVVLNTTPLRPALADIDEAMRQLFAMPLPRLNLERLRPAAGLPEEVRRLLRETLRGGLTEEGWGLCDVEAVARLALGRQPLAPGEDARALALATAWDYLLCADTVGQARPGFAAVLPALVGGAFGPDPARLAAERRQDQGVESAGRRVAEEERLRFVAERERRASVVAAARTALGRPADPQARAVGRTLTEAAARLRAARGPDALEATWAAVQPFLQQAEAHTAAEARHRQQAADAAMAERGRAEQQRQARRAWEDRRAAVGLLMRAEPGDMLRGLARLGEVSWVEPPRPQPLSPAAPAGARLANWMERVLPGGGYYATAAGQRVWAGSAPALLAAAYQAADAEVVRRGGRARPRRVQPARPPSPLAAAPPAPSHSRGRKPRATGRHG